MLSVLGAVAPMVKTLFKTIDKTIDNKADAEKIKQNIQQQLLSGQLKELEAHFNWKNILFVRMVNIKDFIRLISIHHKAINLLKIHIVSLNKII